ncbi:hypothetical protein [Bacillus sp. 165]|nr:hypothetical protein [Bacillus sp. 165]MBO9129222.1 hypothetical protein [Bacillus sp. 165]
MNNEDWVSNAITDAYKSGPESYEENLVNPYSKLKRPEENSPQTDLK